MKQPVHFFLGQQFMGTGAIEMLNHDPKHSPPLSVAYFCPVCGEVWARAVITGQAYEVWALLCEKHPLEYPYRVPGSLWLTWNATHNDSLTREMLTREVDLHLEHYDKFKDQLT